MNKNARETSGSKRLHLKRCKERLRVRDTHTHVHCKARALHIFSPNAFLNGRVHVKIHRQNPHSFKFISMTTKINTRKPKISELTQSTSINTFDFTSTEQRSPLMPHHQQQKQVLHRQSLENESFYFWRRKKTAADQNKTLNRFFYRHNSQLFFADFFQIAVNDSPTVPLFFPSLAIAIVVFVDSLSFFLSTSLPPPPVLFQRHATALTFSIHFLFTNSVSVASWFQFYLSPSLPFRSLSLFVCLVSFLLFYSS